MTGRRIAVAGVAMLTLTGCGGSTTTSATTSSPRPGVHDVHAQLDAMTDCRQLEAKYQTFKANLERDKQRSRSDLVEVDISYMETATSRMEKVGCK